MTIEFKKDHNIKPRHVTTCKQIPQHYQETADKLVDKLLRDEVIEPVPIDETSEWISPAFFVPKEGGKAGVRLVTDFTQLNKAIKRPVHPFPSANDITRKIQAETKFFAKMDATQGYHQVPLAEESRKFTTFLIPRGKFRYRRGPMGLRSTNDCWCARSDIVIQGLPNVSKIVDNILVTAPTIDKLHKTLRIILERCRKQGLTISERKLQIGTNISFAGFSVSPDGVKPDPGKVKAI